MPYLVRNIGLWRLAAAGAALAALTSGCAPRSEAISSQLQEVQRELSALRADNLIMKDRLEALEEAEPPASAAQASEASSEAAPTRSPVSDRPRLAVVRLSPETQPGSTDGGASASMAKEPRVPVDIVGDARGVKQQAPGTGAPKRPGPSFRRK